MLDQLLLEVLKLEGPKLLAVFLIVLGYGLKAIPMFPNRFIPAFVLLLGTALGPVLLAWPQSTEQDSGLKFADIAAWLQILIAGFLVGALSWALHEKLLKKWIDDKIPALNGKKNGNGHAPVGP